MATNNMQVIQFNDGRRVCTSYGVPVAVYVPGDGYKRTTRRYSVTTSKHMNAFAGKDAPEVDAATFAALVAPLEVK